MSTKNQKYYAIMRNKIRRALKNDTTITVTFKSKSPRMLNSVTRSGKEVYQVNKKSRTLELNQSFIQSAAIEARGIKGKDQIDVILRRLFDLRHDFHAQFFMIDA